MRKGIFSTVSEQGKLLFSSQLKYKIFVSIKNAGSFMPLKTLVFFSVPLAVIRYLSPSRALTQVDTHTDDSAVSVNREAALSGLRFNFNRALDAEDLNHLPLGIISDVPSHGIRFNGNRTQVDKVTIHSPLQIILDPRRYYDYVFLLS